MKFAHISDVHLGAFREPELRRLCLKAFEKAVDECVERGVDFVIIAGDLFDTALPDLSVVDKAVRKMRSSGLKFYVVYGSHDYSPSETSVIDVLNSAGVLHKVAIGDYGDDGKLRLEFVSDEASGTKITGLSARRRGLEKKEFEELHLDSLEKGGGFKVFVFHSAIEEHKPDFLKAMEGVPLKLFPKGFGYYAGGHVHVRDEIKAQGFGPIVFPGPLFAGDFRDLEDLSKNNHGFYVVEAGDDGVKPAFVPVEVAEAEFIEFDAGGKKPEQVQEALEKKALECEAENKVVLVKVFGELSAGNPGEIDFHRVRSLFGDALVVRINRNKLSSRERLEIAVKGENKQEIEAELFKQGLEGKDFGVGLDEKLAKQLLEALKEEKTEGETKKDFEERASSKAKSVLREWLQA